MILEKMYNNNKTKVLKNIIPLIILSAKFLYIYNILNL